MRIRKYCVKHDCYKSEERDGQSKKPKATKKDYKEHEQEEKRHDDLVRLSEKSNGMLIVSAGELHVQTLVTSLPITIEVVRVVAVVA